MRQRGSRRVRPRAVSNDGGSVDTVLDLATSTDQLTDVTTKKDSDADENVTNVRTVSNDDVTIAATREYLHCLDERRTKSERYFL